MDWTQAMQFVYVAALVEISPGPNFLLISNTVPTTGTRVAYANIAGFAFAFCVHGALSIGGVSIIVAQSEILFYSVKYAGAFYLCWLGIKALLESRKPLSSPATLAQCRRKPISLGFREGLLTNLLNPKISLFYLAMFPQFVTADNATTSACAQLVGLHIIINACWFTFIIRTADRLIIATRNINIVHYLNLVSGVALIGLGVFFMTASI